jgi:hypothetical protein
VLIDFSSRRFKEYRSVSGVKSGEWLPLPCILTVKVTENSYLSTNTPNGISPTLSGKVTVFKMLVYSDDTETMLSFEYASRKKALRDARRLASGLGADLVQSPALESD